MTIKEEFEKAYGEIEVDGEHDGDRAVFFAGAKWMAERCAKEVSHWPECHDNYEFEDKIRQLAKDLE